MEIKIPQKEPTVLPATSQQKSQWRVWLPACLALSAILVLFAVLLTYVLATDAQRTRDLRTIAEQIKQEQEAEQQPQGNLALLESILQKRSLYQSSLDSETFLQAVFQQYCEISGDPYAEYYSEEAYQILRTQMTGQVVGIGVSFTEESLLFEEQEIAALRITFVQDQSPAQRAGLTTGEWVVAIQNADGTFETVTDLGFKKAAFSIQGEADTTVVLRVLHQESGNISSRDVSCIRETIEEISVEGNLLESDPGTAIIRIKNFAYNTPVQFCRVLDACRAQGATRFVLDVRNNAGGSVISVCTVLSYFLQQEDTIYIEKYGNGSVSEVKCQPKIYTGLSESCSITEEQIGQYRISGISYVVLCNENTKSAAELFTATLAEAGIARVVGEKTFGKWMAQTLMEIPFDDFRSYIRFTIYECLTQNGISYQNIGFSPDIEVIPDPAYQKLDPAELTWEQDLQLQVAVQTVKS